MKILHLLMSNKYAGAEHVVITIINGLKMKKSRNRKIVTVGEKMKLTN